MLTRTYTPTPVNRRKMLLLAALALTLGLLLPLYSSIVSPTGGKLALRAPDGLGLNAAQNLPLSFEPNAGQTDSSAHFVAHAPGGTLFFAPSEVVLALQTGSVTEDDLAKRPASSYSAANTPQSDVVRVQFVGANTTADIQAGSELAGKVNYIKGADHANWHTGLPTYGGITYSGLYAGVDLRYEGAGGKLKGTYALAPGADPSAISWRYSGASKARIDDAGNLQIVVNSQLTLTEQTPVAWQEINGQHIEVGVNYVEQGQGAFGFTLGNYDHSRPLTIDPTLTYSTYLGGFYGDSSGSIALDSQGNIYVTGSTSSSDFPTAGNPFQPVWGGQSDAFVTKLSADGSTLIYSTFLGGGGEIDGGEFARFISVDEEGNVIVGGSTDADDFPTTPDAYQIIYAGTTDLFVTKLNATGSDLIFSTYYGDPGANDPGGFAVDEAGNTYLTAYTYPGRDSYATVAELSADGSQLIFERSLGGNIPGPGDENANSAGQGIAIDPAGNIYVTGYTRAANFPVTAGAYRTTIQAFEDGFLTKLAPGGQTILYSTYIPGGVSEYPFDVTVDGAGNAFVTGSTSSADYPTTPGAFQTVKGDPTIAFVTKFNPTGSDLVYSTFLGDTEFNFEGTDYPFAVKVNGAGSAYVAGYTNSPNFPLANPIQNVMRGPYDAFVTKLNAAGSALDFSTFLGGTGGDVAEGIAVDSFGTMHIAGWTSSTDFPVVDPVQPMNHGASDAIIAKITDPEGAVSPTPTRTGTPPTFTPSPSPTVCTPSPDYVFHRFFGSTLVPGTQDIGNHCEDCTTLITLPFPVRFYGQTFNTANVSSNGNIQFLSSDETGLTECGPFAFFNYAIMPHQADLNTEAGGVYTSISGTAPNRIFNVEWRACVYDLIEFTCDENVNFEARLYENSPTEQIDFIYGQVDSTEGIPAVVALQEGTGTHYKEFSCNQSELQAGMRIEFTRNTCAVTTSTPVGTPPTATATRTAPPATPTPDPCHNVTPWRNESPMPIPFARSAAAVVNDQLYVIGGAANSPTPVRYTQRFDPIANAWATASPIPNDVGVAYSQAAGIGSKIYMVGNTYQPGESFIQIYDTGADTWSRAATLPEPLSGGALAAYDGKIYLFGGQVVNQPGTNHVYMYDPATNTITARAPMPSGQAEIGAATIGNRIYVVGGYQYIHYAYDPVADTWTTIAQPLTPNFSVPGVFSFGGELWVTTGRDNPGQHGYPPNQEIQIYNPAANQWRFGPALNVPRYYSTAVGVINGRAYIVGGIDLNSENYPHVYLSSMESIAYVQCGTPTPSTATPIASTVTATSVATGTPPSVTHTATPATCAITFSDVAEGSTFYPFVRCLVCRGIISGYADGTFRPNNDVTRGQLSKIVANAAGFEEAVSGQTFEDVSPGATFYQFIQRMSARQIISGYPCGGPGEPCLSGKPYFRPNANATRGQISKIVANSAGINDPAGAQRFEDVLPNSTFYDYIQRLAGRNVMSGYPCGGPGEPCMSGNRPYFRPNANATRGQTTKIVSNTFFPDCSPLARR